MLEGAAVAGEPFEPELAAAAAAAETDVLDAIDELLQLDPIRQTDVPRRFRFRHPLVRRGGLRDHAGRLAAWRADGAPRLSRHEVRPWRRAQHVELSARQGDLDAVELLRKAGEATARLAPETAARWFGGALLLPDTARPEERVELLLARARALAAAGHFGESHVALLEASAMVLTGPVASARASRRRAPGWSASSGDTRSPMFDSSGPSRASPSRLRSSRSDC